MTTFMNTAVLGSGVIGASWAALFLASGRNVAVFDAAPSSGNIDAGLCRDGLAGFA